MSKEQCINNWREMHEGNSYFLKHPHYVGLHLNSGNIAQEIDSYVGLFFEDDVLEIGCGYGRLMSALTQQVKSVTGVDLHNAPLAVAREMHADKSNLRFVQNDGFSLPFKDNNFDLVYSFSAFQHMPREVVASYVKESIRVLRFGGRFCLQFLSAPYGVKDINPVNKCEQSVGWDKAEIERLFLGIESVSRKYIGVEDCAIGIVLTGVVE